MTRATSAGEECRTSCGARLVAADGRELILRGVTLRVDAAGGIARTVLEQRFASPWDEPLTLVYQLPLPADGAVAGFAFRVGDRRITGEIDRRESARRRFEDAILAGRTAALVEQERSSLFTQEIGNVPPRAEVVAEITVDQKLRWLGEGSWEWRFPTVVAPRYLDALGRVPDAERVTVDVIEAAPPVSLALELALRDALAPDAEPCSPSHAIHATRDDKTCRIELADGHTALDRDLVVRWPVATAEIGTRLEVARPGSEERNADQSFGLLTIVPPAEAADRQPIARDLVVLIDASGSMHGEPLEQARRIAQALVRSLDARDTLELIAFSSEPLRFRARAEQASDRLRADAIEWLGKLQAGGGTEMAGAVAAALAPLRAGAQRQVVLVTDGLIGFEDAVVAHVLRALPDSARLHTVGVGSAVNRSLTSAAARAGRGVEIVVGLEDDGAAAAERLLAQLGAPLVGEIEVRGSAVRRCAPARLRDLAAGAPVLVALELHHAGGELEIRGHGFERRIPVPAAAPGTGSPALAPLFARERVEDLEMRAVAGEKVDDQIESIGMAFAIATRRTSWVAVAEEPSVDPRKPTRRVKIAQAVPRGMSVEGLGLRSGFPALRRARAMDVCEDSGLGPQESAGPPSFETARSRRPGGPLGRLLSRVRGGEPRGRRGRIVSMRDSELVIEIAVGDEPLDWNPAALADLRFPTARSGRPDGVSVRVDLARSTAPGPVGAQLVIRLVLRLDAPLPAAPSVLEIESAGERLRVALRG
jgi:Ca-activated chloride channel family protein